MAKVFILFFLFILILNCNRQPLERNPFLQNVPVSYEINLNLPQYNDLLFDGGTVIIENQGINGIVVIKTTSDQYAAWERTCPNHAVEICSTLRTENGIGKCECEEYQYTFLTGQLINPPSGVSTRLYPLLSYRIAIMDNKLLITN